MNTADAAQASEIPGRRLDIKAIRRAFDRAARDDAEDHAVFAETATRMSGRLDYIRLEPHRILDAGCGQVRATRLLTGRFPSAAVCGLDGSLARAQAARRREPLLARAKMALGIGNSQIVCGAIEALPFADASMDMIWSNLALAWVQDAGRAFHEFHRVLNEGGLLMFSTYGPDTLRELRDAFSKVDDKPHVHEFPDMHDLGDLLLAGGFEAPVMDMDKIVYSYAAVEQMVTELRGSGQINASAHRRRGLTSPAAWKAMIEAYVRREQDGRIEATFEIVYGHAWKGRQRRRSGDAQSGAKTIDWFPKKIMQR